MEDGIIRDMPEDEYHAIDRCSYSRLKVLASKTAAHLRRELDTPRDTPAMRVGSALHCLVLEGREAYADAYAVGGPVNPKTGRPYGVETAAYAEWEASIGKPVLTARHSEQVEGMAAAILSHPGAAGLLGLCPDRELTLLATLHGQPCKARADAYGEGIILDIKTTGRGAGRAEFERTIGSMGYGIQSAFYGCVAYACGLPVEGFCFIVVEDEPPYGVACYRMLDEVVVLYEQLLPPLLERYGDCVASGKWPGYADGVQDVGVPGWLRRAIEEKVEGAEWA